MKLGQKLIVSIGTMFIFQKQVLKMNSRLWRPRLTKSLSQQSDIFRYSYLLISQQSDIFRYSHLLISQQSYIYSVRWIFMKYE